MFLEFNHLRMIRRWLFTEPLVFVSSIAWIRLEKGEMFMKKIIVSCVTGLVLVFCMGYTESSFAMEFTEVENSDCRGGTNHLNRVCNEWSELTEMEHPDTWDRARRNREPHHRWYSIGERTAEGKMVSMTLEGVLFDFDKSDLRTSALPKLERNVAKLKDMEFNRVNVIGYTDSKGTEEYNQGLSEKRAQVVRDYLVEQGIASDRIMVEGRGESEAIAPNTMASGKDSPAGRAKNRRAIELQIWTQK
jgi:outer membrane protein OmpA-like peptidoglycan-associated protein